MMPEVAQVWDFAKRYTAGWCSQNPASVAAFFAPNGKMARGASAYRAIRMPAPKRVEGLQT